MLQLYTPNYTDSHLIADGMVISYLSIHTTEREEVI